MEIKDSGTRDTFSTGAVRDGQVGKGRYDLLPYWPIFKLACVFEAGAKKYAPRNWEKGIPLSRFADSGRRHFEKWMNGDRDEDHLHQAIWNFVCLSQTMKWIEEGKLPAELNDLPNNPIDCVMRLKEIVKSVVPDNVPIKPRNTTADYDWLFIKDNVVYKVWRPYSPHTSVTVATDMAVDDILDDIAEGRLCYDFDPHGLKSK